MSYQVKIHQTGQEFLVDHGASVLESAILAGIAMDYGCSNGNCGQCKARVLQGEITAIRHHDFVIPQAEQVQGYALMCSNTAASNLLIDAKIAVEASQIPVRSFRAKLRRLQSVNHNLSILHLQTPRTHRLRFLAGQYATLTVNGAEGRDYSIASCPCDDLRLEFHVRRIEGDAFSEIVFNSLKQGDWLEIEAPRGQFVIREPSLRPLIFIAFDTGFAAIKSQLEHVTAQEKEREIELIWFACGNDGHYLNNLCRSWCDALDNFVYKPVSIEAEYRQLKGSDMSQGSDGIALLESTLKKELQSVASLRQSDIYISAPPPALKTMCRVLANLGVEPNAIRTEPVRGDQDMVCLDTRP